MVFSLGTGSVRAEDYSINVGSTSLKLMRISSQGCDLFLSTRFRNDGSKGTSMSSEYMVTVWQNGRECERNYFHKNDKDSSTKVKDGVGVSVMQVFDLRDSRSVVEVNVQKYFAWGEKSEFTVYYNPVSRKYGTKEEVSKINTETPKPSSSPTPEITGASLQNEEKQSMERLQDSEWICPDCGKKLSSKFCPDCGTASPTPKPTATPSPSPSPVPIDLGKQVENVVKAPYIMIDNGTEIKGLYTGEMIDGFPHGFGVFDSGIWACIGEWNEGRRLTGGVYRRGAEYDFRDENIGERADRHLLEILNTGTTTYTAAVGENSFDPSLLLWKGKRIKLEQKDWDKVAKLDLNLFFDTGEGYINMGEDKSFTIEENALVYDYDYTWLSIDGQPVSFYFLSQLAHGEEWIWWGYVPVEINGKEMYIIVESSSGEENMSIIGATVSIPDREKERWNGAELIPIKTGDQIQCLYEFITYDGYISTEKIGTAIQFKDDLIIAFCDFGEDSSKTIATYTISDNTGNKYWTPILHMTDESEGTKQTDQ